MTARRDPARRRAGGTNPDRDLAGGTEGRELAALVDGPWARCWYWRTDLEAQQAASRDVHARGGTAQLGDRAHYRPTDTWITSPDDATRGRAWTYQPPTLAAQRRSPEGTENPEAPGPAISGGTRVRVGERCGEGAAAATGRPSVVVGAPGRWSGAVGGPAGQRRSRRAGDHDGTLAVFPIVAVTGCGR